MRSPWAREYARTPNRYVWGTEASALAHQVSELLPTGARVLDLGCGEGRDSVFFAQRGFDVTGVDVARSGLAKAERLACGRGVRVRWVCGDIGRLDALPVLEECFDLIYSCGAIHYVPRAVRAKLVPRLKAITREHGLHAHIVFTDRAVYVEKGERIDYFAPGELTAFYPDWAILTREQRVTDCDQDGIAIAWSSSSRARRTGPPRRRDESGRRLEVTTVVGTEPSLRASRHSPGCGCAPGWVRG